MNVERVDIRFVLTAVCCLFPLLTACRKEVREEAPMEKRTVVFGADAPHTRSSLSGHEGDVRSLDVLVFRRQDGSLDAHARSTATGGDGNVTSVSAEVTYGLQHDWYVVANAPEDAFDAVSSKQDFVSGRVLLEGSEPYLAMYQAGSISSWPSEGPVSVYLERYACKVSVGSVTVAWEDAFAMPGGVRLGRIALVNAVASCLWSGTADQDAVWLNRMGVDTEAGEAVVADLGGVEMSGGVAVQTGSPLYCMPNGVVNGHDSANHPEWTARPTRVAVEILIGGVSNWYPVTLPSMARNTHYRVNSLTVTGPGAAGPDFPVTRDDVQFSVEIVPWSDFEVPTMYDEN